MTVAQIVKSSLQTASLQQIVTGAQENGEFIYSGKDEDEERFVNGIFSFEGSENGNHIIRANASLVGRDGYEEPHSLYELNGLSYSFLI